MKALVALICLLAHNSSLAQKTSNPECHRGSPGLTKNIATKAPYEFVADMEVKNETLEGCEVAKFWLNARHGTRYPSKAGIKDITKRLPEMIQEIEENVRNGRSILCPELISQMKQWAPEMSPDMAKSLHPEGEREFILLAERFQNRFRPFLSEDYHDVWYQFRATDTERANKSQSFFARGLFGRLEERRVFYDPPLRPHDPVIRPYKLCVKWLKDVKKNPKTLEEQRKFESSQFFVQNLLNPLSKRLGLSKLMELSDLDALYNGCTFGQAWHPNKESVWCKVFTDSELELMEYREDLEYYWIDGYANDISWQQACVLAEDVIKNFDDLASEKKATFYFTHSGTNLKMVAFLGLFEDSEKLRHDNYDKMRDRLWKTSTFNSFGANTAFVLQTCDDSGPKIGFYLNERLTRIPNCSQDWCDYQEFRQIVRKRVQVCDNDALCQVSADEDTDAILASAADDRF